MSWLHGVSARSLRHFESLEIDLSPEKGHERRHLILIGPNGSAKSTLLDAISDELLAAIEGRVHPAAEFDEASGDPDKLDRSVRHAHFGRPVRLTWAKPIKEVQAAFAAGKLIVLHLGDPRETAIAPAAQPTPTDTDPKPPRERAGGKLAQLLVNRRNEFLAVDRSGDKARSRAYESWFARVQGALARLLHQPELTLVYQRDAFVIHLSDGRRMHLDELSRGHAAAVAIWAELMMRVEAARLRNDDPALEPCGVAIVDAAEAGLDVRLQRELFPALAALYPRVQLVMATHSPLVALSLDDAIILDVVRGSARAVDEVRREGHEALLASMIAPVEPRPISQSSRPPPSQESAAPRFSSAPPPQFTPPPPPPAKKSTPPPIPKRSAPPPPPPKRSVPPTQRMPALFAPPEPKPDKTDVSPMPTPPPFKTETISVSSLEDTIPPIPPEQTKKASTIPPPPGKLPPKKPSGAPRPRKDTLSGSGPWAPDED
jgi:predicted ATPase